ncbi:MAG TPA: DUF3822 family protein [Saprospiraceae bacterium]|nr:DUF3822 family protein [Saprospiraceae bacterium]
MNRNNKHINTEECSLSVFVEPDRFHYGIFSDEFTLQEVSNPEGYSLEEVFEVLEAGLSFKSIYLLHAGEALHLPKSLVTETPVREVIGNDFGGGYNYDKLIDQAAETHYFLDPLINEWAEKVNSNYSIKHLSSAVSEYLYPCVYPKVFAIISKPYLFIQVCDRDGIRFYNRFLWQHASDVLYFISACYQEMKLYPHSQPLEIAGRISKGDEVSILLREHFGEIFYSEPMLLKFDKSINMTVRHYYFELYLAQLCG